MYSIPRPNEEDLKRWRVSLSFVLFEKNGHVRNKWRMKINLTETQVKFSGKTANKIAHARQVTLHLLVDLSQSTDLRVQLQAHQLFEIFTLLRMLCQCLICIAHFLYVAFHLQDHEQCRPLHHMVKSAEGMLVDVNLRPTNKTFFQNHNYS